MKWDNKTDESPRQACERQPASWLAEYHDWVRASWGGEALKAVPKTNLSATLLRMEKTPELRIALYARVSTRDKGQDYENQLRELREFVGRNSYSRDVLWR